MKKLILSPLLFAFLFAGAITHDILNEKSQTIAINFIAENSGKIPGEIDVISSFTETENGRTLYYIHNISDGGFVVVSATELVRPVLAYTFSGSYCETDQPPAFKAWMEQYARQIEFALRSNNEKLPGIESQWKHYLEFEPEVEKEVGSKSVEPMLISTWNQGQYYNMMCPADPGGPAGHCYTGCVATAMGQLCYYFRWPDIGTGSYTYQHPVYGTITANFGESRYRWNEMTNAISGPNPAIAELLFHLGVSVDMDYGPDGSGMWNHKAAYSLRTYFKYAPETEYLFRDSTNLDWDSTIVAHLDQGIPMYYAGWSVPNVNGHAFIVDGYQDEAYFHFNWGWGGSYDGYFYLDELTPGGSNFNLAQELVIHCVPDTNLYTYPPFCTSADTLKSLAGTIDDGSYAQYNYQNNISCSWLINPQNQFDSVSYIKLSFDRLQTESGVDLVTIYDGPDIASPILGSYSGNLLPEEIISTGNRVFIKFETNSSVTDEGWFVSYRSLQPVWCNGVTILSEPEGWVSDGSGTFNYRNSSVCMWKIEPPFASDLTLTFTSFDTEPDKDMVKIYDSGSSQLLAEYSGNYEPGNPPPAVTSPSGKMLIAFSTDPTNTFAGWEATYTVGNVGVDRLNSDADLTVMPNPAQDYFYVYFPRHLSGRVELSILTMSGKQVFHETRSQPVNPAVIPSDRFDPGIYLIRVNAAGKVLNAKLVLK